MNAAAASMQTTPANGGNLQVLYLIMAAFFIALLPFVATFTKHHPDERHYTDAAIQMVKSGDYLLPKSAEGELRLKKPVVTYWLVAASYRWIGISPITSRLPFLLIGTAVIGLTYCFATRVFNSRSVGLAAACVVALQPSLLISSIRSIPDIVLTASILLSAIGFARLYTRPRHDWYSIGFAYLGLAIAIESKGIPAVVFGTIAFAILLLCRIRECKLYLLRHVIGIALCIAVSSSWFLYVLYQNPRELFLQFCGDQLGSERLDNSVSQIAIDLAVVLLLLAACSFPWLPAIAEAIRPKFNLKALSSLLVLSELRAWIVSRPCETLILVWTLVYLILASCVDRINIRYQCPIAPFVASLVGCCLMSLSQSRLELWLNRLTRSSALIMIACSLLVAVVCNSLSTHTIAVSLMIGMIFSCVVLMMLSIRGSFRWRGELATSTLLILGTVPVTFVGFDTLANSKFESRVLATLRDTAPNGSTLAVMTVPAHGSRLRVRSAGSAKVEYHGDATPQMRTHRDFIAFDVMLLSGADSQKFSLAEYDLTFVHNGYSQLNAGKLIRHFIAGDMSRYLKQHQDYVVLAVRKPEVIAARAARIKPKVRIAIQPDNAFQNDGGATGRY